MNLQIFAKTIEPQVYDQVYRMMSVDAFRDVKVRIMPDTHAGMGCVNFPSGHEIRFPC